MKVVIGRWDYGRFASYGKRTLKSQQRRRIYAVYVSLGKT